MARIGTSEQLSIGFDGSPANGASGAPDLSPDGRWVAFVSEASNLVPDDGNGVSDIFLLDRQSLAVERVSVAADGSEGDGASGELATGRRLPFDSLAESPGVSSGGRFVVFGSDADNLVPGDGNGFRDVFLVDRQADTITRISSSTIGQEEAGESFAPTMTPDGSFVAFLSAADNLVAGDANGETDVFLFDRVRGELERIGDGARDLGLDRVDLGIGPPAISADGRFIVYGFGADQLGELPPEQSDDLTAPNEPNVEVGVFVHDTKTGQTSFLGRETTYTQEAFDNPPSTEPAISADGTIVAFVNGHVMGTRILALGLFQDLTLLDRASGDEVTTIAGSTTRQGPHPIYSPSLSADGALIGYGFDDAALSPAQSAVVRDVEADARVVAVGGGWTTIESVDLADDGSAFAFAGVENIQDGSIASDLFVRDLPLFAVGTDSRDKVNGSKGDDDLLGLAGDDTLSGKAEEDRLDGGLGDDLLKGGSGEDVFILGPDAGLDTIKDFAPGDLLDLTAWFLSLDSLPESWRDGLRPGDLGVSSTAKALQIDLGATVGGAAGVDVVTIAKVAELPLGTLIVEDPGAF